MDWVTTTSILEGLADFGNPVAWGRLTDRFRAPIVAFAVRMGVREPEAEDIAQETLLAFAEGYRKGGYDLGKGHLGDWLFGIAYRQLLKMRERLARREAQAPRGGTATSFWAKIPDEKDATTSWDEEWARAVLSQCLQQVRKELEPSTVQAFEMFALVRRPADEVASQLGISRGAVYVAKHRVLNRLRELKEQYEQVA